MWLRVDIQQIEQQLQKLAQKQEKALETARSYTPTPTATDDGRIDINTADAAQLQTLNGVGPVTAQRIIDYRNQIGRFDNVDQLLEVKGIGEKTLTKFRDQVCAR